ncbi:hypothetical protein L1887_54802 [Cichorium endivia]|nr:hypothetical protein L1887_54802 [Cichorium endivia]
MPAPLALSLSLGLSLCALCQPKLPKKREGECMDRAPLTYGHAPTATLGSHSAVRLPCAVLCGAVAVQSRVSFWKFNQNVHSPRADKQTNTQTLQSTPRPTTHTPQPLSLSQAVGFGAMLS